MNTDLVVWRKQGTQALDINLGTRATYPHLVRHVAQPVPSHTDAMDAGFTRAVREAREQGKARDAFIAHATRRWAPIPVTSRHVVPCADSGLSDTTFYGDIRMAMRYRYSKRMQARAIPETPEASAARVHVVSINGCAHVIHTSDMSADMRATIRIYLDMAQRETVTYAERAELSKHVAAITTDGREGLGAIREARVNVRGAYGKRGVKVAPGKQVKRRDNYMPAELLKPVVTVGMPTFHNADPADYDRIIREARKDPGICKVRVWNQKLVTCLTRSEAAYGRGIIVPIAEYGHVTAKRPRAVQRATEAIVATPDTRPDVLRYRAIIGELGNID